MERRDVMGRRDVTKRSCAALPYEAVRATRPSRTRTRAQRDPVSPSPGHLRHRPVAARAPRTTCPARTRTRAHRKLCVPLRRSPRPTDHPPREDPHQSSERPPGAAVSPSVKASRSRGPRQSTPRALCHRPMAARAPRSPRPSRTHAKGHREPCVSAPSRPVRATPKHTASRLSPPVRPPGRRCDPVSPASRPRGATPPGGRSR